MHRDYKIGLVIGLVLAAIAGVFVARLPGLSLLAKPKSVTNLPAKTTQTQTKILPPRPNIPVEDNTTPAPPRKPKTPKTHIVQKGESLSTIAQLHYGSSTQTEKIRLANAIKDPTKLMPGQKLKIPD